MKRGGAWPCARRRPPLRQREGASCADLPDSCSHTSEWWKQFSYKIEGFFHRKEKNQNPQVLGGVYHDSIFKYQPQQQSSSVSHFNCIKPTWINFIKPIRIQRCIFLIVFVYFYLQKEKRAYGFKPNKKTRLKVEEETEECVGFYFWKGIWKTNRRHTGRANSWSGCWCPWIWNSVWKNNS